jgi:predicted nucleotidyltransferase
MAAEPEVLITDIVKRLQPLEGVTALTLGGSRARGTATAASDIDIGIYYAQSHPLDLETLQQVATDLDDQHRDHLMTEIGEWGPWINGGGWLTVQGIAVDLLYRDLEQVATCIADCCAGQITIAYQVGHPYGFCNSIYLAEVALGRSLWDPTGRLQALQAQTRSYPTLLKQTILQKFFWEAEFCLGIARKSISRRDVTYASGCCFRGVMCLMQILFALNEQYWMNEKGAVALASTFPLCPAQLQERIDQLFAGLAAEETAIATAIRQLQELVQETALLIQKRCF